MGLEDHVGDVVCKARAAADIDAGVVAEVAGLTLEQWEEFEDTGLCDSPPDLPAVARLLGLNVTKLMQLAEGWEPAPVDLSRWKHLHLIATDNGRMAVNAYLVWDDMTREAALFDTGWEEAPIVKLVEEHGLKLNQIFITHSHGDHVAALGALRRRYPLAAIHSNAEGAAAAQNNRPGQVIGVGSLRVSNRPTPGHAEDGVTFIITGWPEGAPDVAVVGDAIFAGSMGGHKNAPELARSMVRDEILTLPPDTLVCAGHGPLSTIREALDHIPFF